MELEAPDIRKDRPTDPDKTFKDKNIIGLKGKEAQTGPLSSQRNSEFANWLQRNKILSRKNLLFKLNVVTITVYILLHLETDHDDEHFKAQQLQSYNSRRELVLSHFINYEKNFSTPYEPNLSFKEQLEKWLIYPKNTKLCQRAAVESLTDDQIEALIRDSKYESSVNRRNHRVGR